MDIKYSYAYNVQICFEQTLYREYLSGCFAALEWPNGTYFFLRGQA